MSWGWVSWPLFIADLPDYARQQATKTAYGKCPSATPWPILQMQRSETLWRPAFNSGRESTRIPWTQFGYIYIWRKKKNEKGIAVSQRNKQNWLNKFWNRVSQRSKEPWPILSQCFRKHQKTIALSLSLSQVIYISIYLRSSRFTVFKVFQSVSHVLLISPSHSRSMTLAVLLIQHERN